MRRQLQELLGPQGPLAQAFTDYEQRPGQLAMAQAVARAFEEDDFCLVEAGTGTGKTLAYLLPALMSGKKTIVSTGLKNLQDQIFDKDLPFIRKFFGDNFRAARLKGRENYLCPFFLKKTLAQGVLFSGEDRAILEAVNQRAPQTRDGDRSEFSLPEGWPLWAEISAPAERCLGPRCPEFGDCFLWKARRQAAAADLVLVNHHLFMADLAVRASGFGEVLPDWEAAVFDEAHLVEEAATSYFGKNLSSWALSILKRDLDRALPSLSLTTGASFGPQLEIFGRQVEALASRFYKRPGEYELWREGDPEAGPLRDFLINLYHDSLALAEPLKAPARENDELAPLLSRLLEAAGNMLFLAEASSREYVYQAERQGRRLSLSAFPIRVSRQLADGLINTGRTLVFTSATLSSGGDFSYFKDRLGIWPEVEGLAVESPFDYARRTLTYVPTALPQPSEPDFPEAAARHIEELVNLSRGRALVLFTSHKNMNFAADYLRERIKWPLLVQGEAGRAATLEEFTQSTSSVLLATHSFWQGVDVPGESLSAVIIEKLPFPRPDRPLVRARSQLMEEEGRSSFGDYFLPETALTLKQGLGRLMRRRSDQGLLAILDVRLLKKGYGKKLLKTLPPSRLTSDMAEVSAFLKKI
ncbi:MAG: ATP-dependent DNA helicase [Candidatus Adiutrix sp.]|jgi:ATP-dependent DNA helicase DinG|nr:ATP-dependent DNA helicase [Candidatus Adiutrix sp.]